MSRPLAPPTRATAVNVVPTREDSLWSWLSCHTRVIGFGERRLEPIGGGFTVWERAQERIDRHPGGNFTTDVAAHPVGDRKEIDRLEGQVLIDLTDSPDIGGRSGSQDGHLATS